MEMSIDEHLLYEMGYNMGFKKGIKGSILKADYEARLKADMVAMLTEIQLEIEELEVPLLYLAEDYEGGVLDCKKIIQQKIDTLRKETKK